MSTITPMEPSGSPKEEHRLDFSLLQAIVKRRLRLWIVAGSLLFLGFLAYGLCFLPQSFTATTSLSFQQPLMPTSALSLFSGANSGATRYLGIIRSRLFAEQVEKIVHFQEAFQVPKYDDAVEILMKTIKVEDNPQDGLLYIHISLNGPARLALHAEAKRKQAQQMAAQIANAYTQVLTGYMSDTDVSREAVLYREGQKRLDEARNAYDTAVRNLVTVARSKKLQPGAIPSGGMEMSSDTGGGSGGGSDLEGGSGKIATATAELLALYQRRGRLEATIKAAEATQEATNKMVQLSPDQLGQIPPEDDLLATARADVNDERAKLDALLIQYGEGYGPVVRQRRRLRLAESRLQSQVKAILKGNTSQHIRLSAMRAEYEMVLRQLTDAEKRFRIGRDQAVDITNLTNEVKFRLEVLKTVASEFGRLSLQNLSAKSRMNVVDKGLPPHFGKPGILIVTALSLIAALALLAVWLAADYSLLLLRRSPSVS